MMVRTLNNACLRDLREFLSEKITIIGKNNQFNYRFILQIRKDCYILTTRPFINARNTHFSNSSTKIRKNRRNISYKNCVNQAFLDRNHFKNRQFSTV